MFRCAITFCLWAHFERVIILIIRSSNQQFHIIIFSFFKLFQDITLFYYFCYYERKTPIHVKKN